MQPAAPAPLSVIGGRFSPAEIEAHVATFQLDGFVLLRNHFDKSILAQWGSNFTLAAAGKTNRGAARHYVTLPFTEPWADSRIYENPDVLAIVDRIIGPDPVMCQLATDTPILGSEYQPVHRDCEPLFPEEKGETPSYQLAVNFALCPLKITRGTHRMSREEGLKGMEEGKCKLEPLIMNLGDVLIRDVRGLHRGSPNKTNVPRPMVVIGYSRRWLYRPEVGIAMTTAEFKKLSARGKLLRYCHVTDAPQTSVEKYGAEFVPGLSMMK